MIQTTLIDFGVALGIGLLIGAERERRKGVGASRNAAGIRTFAVAALMGAVAMSAGGVELLWLAVLLVGIGVMVAYHKSRSEDPGLTTELALILTCILGGQVMVDRILAASLGVMLSLVLAARQSIHHFVNKLLSDQDLHDTLLFAAIALIVLPWTPNHFMGPFGAFNPHHLVTLMVAVMTISALGYVGIRWLGPRYGLPLVGFASGFVSSTATIHSMGQRASQHPTTLLPAVSGAILSSLATILQLVGLIAVLSPDLAILMAMPLLLAGVAAAGYGLLFLLRCVREPDTGISAPVGRAFNLKASVSFALVLGGVMMLAAMLNAWLGERGILLSALVTGLVDAHATALSAASLVTAEKITASHAILPVLLGLTTNTVVKAVVSLNAGGWVFAQKIIPGLVLMLIGLWVGYYLG